MATSPDIIKKFNADQERQLRIPRQKQIETYNWVGFFAEFADEDGLLSVSQVSSGMDQLETLLTREEAVACFKYI